MAYKSRNNSGIEHIGQRRRVPALSNNFVSAGQLSSGHYKLQESSNLFENSSPKSRASECNNQQQQRRYLNPSAIYHQQNTNKQKSDTVATSIASNMTSNGRNNNEIKIKTDPEQMDCNGKSSVKNFFQQRKLATRMKSIVKPSRSERKKLLNLRLSKLLQPKNALMVIHEMAQNPDYTVINNSDPNDDVYKAILTLEGKEYCGTGRTKNAAKTAAAENALKRFASILRQNQADDGTMPIDVAVNGDDRVDKSSAMEVPWQHLASFALYKLLNSWYDDLDESQIQASLIELNQQPARKLPDNPAHINPCMLMNQMLPHVKYDHESIEGELPNILFEFGCTVNDKKYMARGLSKKAAKKAVAFKVCSDVLGVEYPPEIWNATEQMVVNQ